MWLLDTKRAIHSGQEDQAEYGGGSDDRCLLGGPVRDSKSAFLFIAVVSSNSVVARWRGKKSR